MNAELLSVAVGFALGAVSKQIVSLWQKKAPEIEAALDRADEALEAKLGIDIPDAMQSAWHQIVHGAVDYANRFASDGRFWREVIRAIIAKDPSKAVLLQQELAGLSWDRGIAAVESLMSPELKRVVNDVKETMAVRVAQANAVTAAALPSPDPIKAAEQIRAAVRAIAPAHKPSEGPVNRETIERLIRESQDRQRALEARK